MDARAQLRYRNETRRLVVRRAPVSFGVFMLAVGLASILEAYYHPERIGTLLLVCAIQLLLCFGAVRASRSRRLQKVTLDITLAAAVALAASVTVYFVATAADGSALAFVLLGFQLTVPLLFPWDAWRQLVLALASMALFAAHVWGPAGSSSLPVAYGVLAVVFGGAMSVVGASLLDGQRRLVLGEKERLSRHVSAFRDLTQTFHGFDPLRALLVACISTLQALPLRRLWTVWQAPGEGGVQAYFARRDREGIQLESFTDPRRLWLEIVDWGDEHEAFVALPGDPRIPASLRTATAGGLLCIPFSFEGEPLGAICADAGGTSLDLSGQEEAFATVLGSGVGIAMANARLFHRVSTASEEKSTFLARIAHELRNPLHTLLWDIDTLRAQQAGPESTVERLRQNTLMTLRAAEELQEFSEVETHRLSTRAEPVPVARVFDELATTAVALVEGRPITFRSTIGAGAETMVTDPFRIRQVLGNLLSNAAKFTGRGSIEVEAERRGESIVLTVRDTGTGIEPAELEAIFTPFYRGRSRAVGITRGMGLGLAIAQEIATVLGGRIEVESAVGVGSTFRLVLPAGIPVASAVPSAAPMVAPPATGRARVSTSQVTLAGVRVIVIEDDMDERSRAADALRASGAEVLEARDGFEGLRRAGEQRPDLVVLDLGLPGLSGIDVLLRLKRDVTLAAVPVVVATAHTDGRLEAHCRAAGCAAYLHKPYAAAELLAAVRRAVPDQQSIPQVNHPLRASVG